MIAYVIPCSGRKLDRAAQARELYTGPMYQHTLKAAEAATSENDRALILVLSARYGLIPLGQVIHPYDQKLGKKGSVDAATVARQAERFGIDDSYLVRALLPRRYLKLLQEGLAASGALVIDQYEGCRGIGEQKARNKAMIEDARRVYFNHSGWYSHRVAWGVYSRDEFIPLLQLVGRVLNVGTKDGLVYEAVTLTAFDERTGILVLEGGQAGSPWSSDESRPLEAPARVQAYDVARGFIHPEG